MSSVCLTSIGLSLNILGAVLLFFFGFPTAIDLGGADQSKDPASVKTHYLAKIGLALLIAGFISQLLGTLWR
jgi:hypothetical protein